MDDADWIVLWFALAAIAIGLAVAAVNYLFFDEGDKGS
jgi:hypothetical protein